MQKTNISNRLNKIENKIPNINNAHPPDHSSLQTTLGGNLVPNNLNVINNDYNIKDDFNNNNNPRTIINNDLDSFPGILAQQSLASSNFPLNQASSAISTEMKINIVNNPKINNYNTNNANNITNIDNNVNNNQAHLNNNYKYIEMLAQKKSQEKSPHRNNLLNYISSEAEQRLNNLKESAMLKKDSPMAKKILADANDNSARKKQNIASPDENNLHFLMNSCSTNLDLNNNFNRNFIIEDNFNNIIASEANYKNLIHNEISKISHENFNDENDQISDNEEDNFDIKRKKYNLNLLALQNFYADQFSSSNNNNINNNNNNNNNIINNKGTIKAF